MKRRRKEMEKQEKKTEIRAAIDELSLLVQLIQYNNKSPSTITTTTTTIVVDDDSQAKDYVVISYIPLKPFLSICSLILQVLDKIGPTMAVLRQDIFKNIQKLEKFSETDKVSYSNVVAIIKKEAVESTAKKGDSCSKAFLWLIRSLDFTAALLQNLAFDPQTSMEQLVRDSYEITLKPWHGWISAAAFKVALKLVPDTNTFITLLMAKGDENLDILKEEIQAFNSLLVPVLEDIHTCLRCNGLENLKST